MSSKASLSNDGDPSVLTRVRAALARYDWQDAHREASDVEGLDDPWAEAALLDARAEAAWWLGDLDECIEAREAAFARFEEVGDVRAAGQCAVWLSEHYRFKAQPAIAGAWLRRARHRLGHDVECIEYGNLVLREAEASHGRGDLVAATADALTIVELGRRLRSPDLEAQALQTVGRVLVDMGRPGEGLGYLDDAMLFALEGQLGPYATGKIYCSLISACEELGDVRRASEWTEATFRWSERHPFALFPGLCRVHHAWALQCRGDWVAAEEEVVRACGQLAGISRVHAAAGYAELGAIRLRLGDLESAESAFREAEALSGRPPAGLALLRLEQGRPDVAAAILTHVLDDETWNRLARAKLLPLQVRVALAVGDDAAAASAVAELARIAVDFDNAPVAAMTATARGRMHLSRGESREACTELRHAVEQWRDLNVPHEIATAHLLLGQAYRASGDEHAASSAFAAAEAGFEALGAKRDVRAVREIRSGSDVPGGLTPREVEVLRLVATGRTNRDIAAELFLSEKTVARHLSNIFTKIRVPSRAAATAFAFDQGLMTGRSSGA